MINVRKYKNLLSVINILPGIPSIPGFPTAPIKIKIWRMTK